MVLYEWKQRYEHDHRNHSGARSGRRQYRAYTYLWQHANQNQRICIPADRLYGRHDHGRSDDGQGAAHPRVATGGGCDARSGGIERGAVDRPVFGCGQYNQSGAHH